MKQNDTVKKLALAGVLTAVAVVGSFISFPILGSKCAPVQHMVNVLAAVVLGIACYFIVPKTDLEYEYLFVNGEMDIDMVMAKSKRKKAKTVNIKEADLVAPLDSHRLDYYNSNSKMKTLDYSSGNPSHKRFAIITRDKGENCKIIIEPDETMQQAIKNSAPSKVFLD